MQLWKFKVGPEAGQLAIVLSTRQLETAAGTTRKMYKLLVAGKVVELSESALKELATALS